MCVFVYMCPLKSSNILFTFINLQYSLIYSQCVQNLCHLCVPLNVNNERVTSCFLCRIQHGCIKPTKVPVPLPFILSLYMCMYVYANTYSSGSSLNQTLCDNTTYETSASHLFIHQQGKTHQDEHPSCTYRKFSSVPYVAGTGLFVVLFVNPLYNKSNGTVDTYVMFIIMFVKHAWAILLAEDL